MLQNMLDELKVKPGDVPVIKDLFYKLLYRRKRFFDDDRRMNVDCEITPVGETFNLRVVSHDLAEEDD